MVEKSANFSIICKDFVFHGEMQKNKSEFFKIEEKEYFFVNFFIFLKDFFKDKRSKH